MLGLGMSICARCLRKPIAKSSRHQGWVISSNGVEVEAPNQPLEDRATTAPRSVFLIPNTDLWGRLCRSLRPLPLRSSRSVGRSVDGRARRGSRAADGLRIHHPLLLPSFSSSFPPSLAWQSTAILSLLWRRRPTYRAIITRENIFLCRENDVFYIGVSERQE